MEDSHFDRMLDNMQPDDRANVLRALDGWRPTQPPQSSVVHVRKPLVVRVLLAFLLLPTALWACAVVPAGMILSAVVPVFGAPLVVIGGAPLGLTVALVLDKRIAVRHTVRTGTEARGQ